MSPQRSSSILDINGHPVFVEVDGEGPPFVALHGLGSSSNSLQPLIPAFSGTFTIYRMDWRGLGRSKLSPTDSEKITIPGYVKDLAALFDHFKLDNAILFGHSLGAIVAMHFAAQYAEIVKGLVLSGPNRSRAKDPQAKAILLGSAKRARELGMPALADGNIANIVAPSSSDVVRAFAREVVAGQDKEGYARVAEALVDKSHVDPDYGNITAKTVIIAGDQDRLSPLPVSQELQGLIGGANTSVGLKVVHSGHMQVLEDTKGVIEAIKSIL